MRAPASTDPPWEGLEPPAPPAKDPSQGKNKSRRKAAPANVPLPRTLDWVKGLPPSVKPTALLRQYARIANVLAATWNDPKALSSYMNCLVRDNRGNRKGLPPEILREIRALREYHATINAEQSSTWTVIGKRG